MTRRIQRRGLLLAAGIGLLGALMSGILPAQGSGGVFGRGNPPQGWTSTTIPQIGPP
jgi:hypothetical protein